MRKGIILISILLFTFIANAQQTGVYNHYFYYPTLYNPAFTGNNDATNVLLINRNQWNNFKGAPKYTALTIDGNLVEKKAGIGFTLVNNKKGITNETGGYLLYSYRLAINDETHLSFGLSLGVINQSIDFSRAVLENNTDPILFTDVQRKTTFDGTAGLAFIWKGLTFGAAVPQLFQNKINYVDNSNIRLYYTQVRHYMASLKYKFYISEAKGISVAPEALVRFVPNTPLEYDGNINLDWKDKFWVGATYKSNYAVAANVGFCVHKQLYLGYSYDFITGNIGTYSGTSQEVMVHFKFGSSKKSTSIANITPEPINTLTDTAQNSDYENRIADLQKEVGESDLKIKELEDKILKLAKEKGPETPPKLSLNDLIYQQLLWKIEAMFDNPNATNAEIQGLRDEIASFLDSDFADENAQRTLKRKYEQLNHAQDVTSVLVKGSILFQKSDLQIGNYSNVSITITDKENNNLIGTYTPNAKTGKYLFILTPGKKYVIKAESKGYETHIEDFSPANAGESYEMTQDIRLLEIAH